MSKISMITRLREFLSNDGVPIETGCPAASIRQFEALNEVRLPKDLEAYFTQINGSNGNYAIGMIRFWGIEEVQRLSDVIPQSSLTGAAIIQSSYSEAILDSEHYFLFADCMHEAQIYAIRLTLENLSNDVILLDGEEPRIVAQSLSEFLGFYMDQSNRIGVTMD